MKGATIDYLPRHDDSQQDRRSFPQWKVIEVRLMHIETLIAPAFNIDGQYCNGSQRKTWCGSSNRLKARSFFNSISRQYRVSIQSSLSTPSLHGTAASINQHPTRNNERQSREHVSLNQSISKLKWLSDWYIEVQPFHLPNDTPAPNQTQIKLQLLVWIRCYMLWLKRLNDFNQMLMANKNLCWCLVLFISKWRYSAISDSPADGLLLCQTLESHLLEWFVALRSQCYKNQVCSPSNCINFILFGDQFIWT